jgi:glutathione peroxidase
MLRKIAEKANAVITRVTQGPPPSGPGPGSLADVALTGLDGEPIPSDAIHGKVILFVNVASRCGLTPQYEQLVALRARFADQGFEVVGTPCNQFLGQEPGTADEIASFCSMTYGVDFPLLTKQDVNGSGRSPLYQFLIGSEAGGGTDIQWNFEKFLVDRAGNVTHRFAPATKPDAPEVVAAIEGLLN